MEVKGKKMVDKSDYCDNKQDMLKTTENLNDSGGRNMCSEKVLGLKSNVNSRNKNMCSPGNHARGLNANKSSMSHKIFHYDNSKDDFNINTINDETESTEMFEIPREKDDPQEVDVISYKASQEVVTPKSSRARGGRPAGKLSKKTVQAEINRQNVAQRYIPSISETMNDQQLFHYNLALNKTEKLEKEIAEERLLVKELQGQLSALQTINNENVENLKREQEYRKFVEVNQESEKEQRKILEQNYNEEINNKRIVEKDFVAEKEKRELAEEKLKHETERRKMVENNYKQILNELRLKEKLEKEGAKMIEELMKKVSTLTTIQNEQEIVIQNQKDEIKECAKTLKEKGDEITVNDKRKEKLLVVLNEITTENRLSKAKLKEVKDDSNLQLEKKEIKKAVGKSKEASEKTNRKFKVQRNARQSRKTKLLPYDKSSKRTQQRKTQNMLHQINAVPAMKEKLLTRFIPKPENIKQKITSLQAVTMAAKIGFNPNQMEQMKSFLRFFKCDVLPPIHLIRKTLKKLKEDFAYVEFQDAKLDVTGRYIPGLKNVISVRGSRLMESGRWVDVPGFEDIAFVGVTSDSGGGFLHCGITVMNVDEGWGSPNNVTIVASGKVPKENYDVVKCVCGNSFEELNDINEKQIEFEVNGITVVKTVIVIACFDGKMGSICSGHCGSSSALPCYSCVCTKNDMNQGITGELRNALTMLQQATYFEDKRKSALKLTENYLSKLRFECQCITKPPLLTLPYTQWIYGILHAVMGPTIKVLDTIEEDALAEDLKELQINIQSSKELRKVNKDLHVEIDNIKCYIDEIKKALLAAKSVVPKWKLIRRKPVEGAPICGAKHCLQNLMKSGPLFATFLKCKCGIFIHATCDLLFINYEIEYAQQSEYLCPQCDPISSEAALNDLKLRQTEWENDLVKLNDILKTKEKQIKDSKIQIPYEKCPRYQNIQLKLKQLKVRKNLYFQKLNGVDVRKLIKNREIFIESIREELRENVLSLFECLNTYQELAEKQFLNDADIDRLNPAELKRAYKAICGEEVPPKVHQLSDHSPNFMRQWHFYQLVNDHAIEHVHRICNVLLQKMCINKDDPQKSLKAITDHFSIRNKLFDLGINIDNLRTLSFEETEKLINNLDTL